MSYILDALQRAEAERARGGVPGLNARPVSPSATPTRLSARQRAALSAAAVGLLSAVAAGFWAWHSPVTVPAAESAPGQTAPTTPPLPMVPLAMTEVAAPPVARVVAPKPVQPPPPPTVVPMATASSPVVASLALLAELPPDIRQQIPALTINGVVYSDNPAQRLLLVNGQVLPQGSQAAPDLTLERIGANSSEFSFRGTRFRMAH